MSRLVSNFRSFLLKVVLLCAVIIAFAGFYMDAWLIEKINSMKWTVPATVYARPLEVYAGLPLSMEAVIQELKAANYQQVANHEGGTFYINGQSLVIHLRSFQFWDGKQPEQTIKLVFSGHYITGFGSTIKGQSGVRLEPMEIGRIHTESHEDRLLVQLKDVPKALIDALTVTEDRDFYHHHGVSVRGIARAFWVNTREGKVVEGASTLTQQLIKNFFLDNNRSYSRKILEICLSVLLELHVSKEDILGAYINEVFVVQNGAKAIHGFGLASQYLFGLPVSNLSVEQSALLVAMLKGPSYYNPIRYPDRAMKRRNLVLSLMAKEGKITSMAARAAMSKPLGLLDRREILANYPAYLDVVRRQLRRDYSDESLKMNGLRIFSNMDPQWQWRAQKALQGGIADLEKRYGKKLSGLDGAVVVTDSTTGDILAVVGGKEPRFSGFNRALDAKRPIGSLIKPVIYLTALESGYSLNSLLSDDPLNIKTAQGKWHPQNYDRQYHGQVLLYQALANSYNVATVRLGMSLGVDKVAETLKGLGVDEEMPLLPASLLGTFSLSPMDIAQAYNTMGNDGFYTPLKSIQEITDIYGRPVKRYPLRLEQRFSPGIAFLLDFALHKVIEEGTGASVRERFRPGQVIAGKTGTTSDQRDSWFAGYDTNKSVVVWLGQDDNRPLPVTGGSGALQIWADIVAANAEIEGQANVPDNIKSVWTDKASGLLSAEDCPEAVLVPYIKGTEPTDPVDCAKTSHKVINWFQKWFH